MAVAGIAVSHSPLGMALGRIATENGSPLLIGPTTAARGPGQPLSIARLYAPVGPGDLVYAPRSLQAGPGTAGVAALRVRWLGQGLAVLVITLLMTLGWLEIGLRLFRAAIFSRSASRPARRPAYPRCGGHLSQRAGRARRA